MKGEDIPNQPGINIQLLLACSRQSHINIPQISEHESAYRSFMKTSAAISKQELITKLQRQFITYSEETFEDSFSITARAYIYNMQIIQVSIIYACFSGQLNILNIDAESPIHSICKYSSGGQGDVFKVYVSGRAYAIKCIYYQEDRFQKTFSNAVTECFLLKIASALEVGPCMRSPFGFDLIIYRNCIQFSMEFCQYMHNYQLERDLKQALQKMHTLKIIHYDIKPANINFSPVYNKSVFIDFGLSKIISQEIGQKSWACFRGSLNYCSSEMQATYLQSDYRLVDLYFNDAECLRKSLASSELSQELGQIWRNPLEQKGDMTGYYEFLLLKRRLYHHFREQKKGKSLVLAINHQVVKKYFAEISQFLRYLPSGLELLVAFHNQLCSKTNIEKQTTKDILAQRLKQEKFVSFNESDVFKQRFQRISALNFKSLNYNGDRNPQLQAQVFKEIQCSMKVNKSIYYLKVLDVIRVEDNNIPMSLKVKVAAQFLCKQLNIINQAQSSIKIALLFLLQHFFTTQANKYSLMILQNSLSSLFFFETITEQQSVQIFCRFIKKEIDLSSKLRLGFKFLAAIQWIEGKYQSIYNYAYLQNELLTRFQQFLRTLSHELMNKTQRLYYNLLKRILQEPLMQSSYQQIGDILSKHRYEEVLALQKDFLKQLYRFTIIRDLDYHRYKGQFDQCCMDRCLKLAAENAKKCVVSLCLFTSLYSMNFDIKKDKLLRFYLSDMNKATENYKQLKQYTVYVYYQLDKFSRHLLNEKDIISLMKMVTKSEKYVVKLQLYTQLIYIHLLKRKEYGREGYQISKSMLQFTHITSSQIVLVPKMLPHYQNHRHQLARAVKKTFTVYNYIRSFRLMAPGSIQIWITKLIQDVHILIADSKCIECKYLSLMFLSDLYTSRQIVRKNYEQAWNIMVDYLVQYIKTDVQTLATLDALINFSIQLDQFHSYKPSLVAMFAEFVYQWRNYEYFFQRGICGQQRLTEVYYFLLNYNRHQQLIQLLELTITYIHVHSGKLYIDIFFMAIYNIIDQINTVEQKDQFYKDHTDIIGHFRKKGFNPYHGFYFFILMLSNCSKGRDLSLLYFIAKSINFFNARCKQLIRNYYYKMFLYHHECTQRKKRYLIKIHLKHQIIDLTCLPQFIKCFRIRNRHDQLQLKTFKQLNKTLKKLHGHIFVKGQKTIIS